MKISKVGSEKSVSKSGSQKAPCAEGSGFMDALKQAAQPQETREIAETSMAQPVESILSVQVIQDTGDQESRKQSKQYGLELLDRLDEIRDGLLVGAISKDKLMELAQSMRQQRRKSDDPQLNQIIDEIELRAEVEIAKLTRNV
jgi:hypothetical protein